MKFLICFIFFKSLIAYDIQVVGQYSHYRHSFTQGLLFHEGQLWESTGRYGQSAIQTSNPFSGKILQQKKLADHYFAEGLALFQQQFYQLTWKSRKVFVWDKFLKLKKTFTLPVSEGWGLTSSDKYLWLSNGSSTLYQLDPNLRIQNKINVTHQGQAVTQINELEWVDGVLFANVWQSNIILMIDPNSGNVLHKLSLDFLWKEFTPSEKISMDVLNGIAWNPKRQTLWVTGKYWSKIFELKLSPDYFLKM